MPTPDDLILPTGNDELVVINELKRIPVFDLYAMTRNPLEFILAFGVFKVLRLPNAPFFAAAMKNQTEIAESQVPESLKPDLVDAIAELRALGFSDPRYLTSPTIGARWCIELIMSTPDGRVQASCVRLQQRNGKIFEDQTYRSLSSHLVGDESGDRVLHTREKKPQPRPASFVVPQEVKTTSFKVLMEHHERRLADETIRPLDAKNQVQASVLDERRINENLIQRGILRPATAKEVFAIEASNAEGKPA